MANNIVGTLPANHSVDQNGSFTIEVPLQLPQAKIMPEISLAYHSADNSPSTVGLGWKIKGASLIERVSATIAQDGFRGVVNYDQDDRFALDGQRLIRISSTGNEHEYRFELERWSKIIAYGSDSANPDYWVENLPDGTTRTFGVTADSNIKAQGGASTRVWAISGHSDAFSNYISFAYNNDTENGSFYLTGVSYGGNTLVSMAHQREIVLEYEDRSDVRVNYMGGYKIRIDKRLSSVTSRVQANVVYKHLLEYDIAPLTATSRLRSLTLADPSGATVRPLDFDWINGQPSVFDPVQQITTIDAGTQTAEIIPMDVYASGRSDIMIASKRLDSSIGAEGLYLAIHQADSLGNVSPSPSPGSGFTGLRYPTQLLPLDFNGDGKTDLLHIVSSVNGSFTLTLLLSTADGYDIQQSLSFTPESANGSFHSGDFQGTGAVGLVYVYQVLITGTPQLKFVQFTSDGTQFTPLAPGYGPLGFSITQTKVVVGDLNGKGAEDVFLISPKMNGSSRVCHISLVESVKGILSYRTDEPLVSSGQSVLWTDSTTFMAYTADNDGKTSLLVISKNINSKLQWQLLRSTGPSFLPSPSPVATEILFDGNVTLAKTTSTYNVDMVNTFESVSGIQVHVLRFDGDTFVPLDGVQQPQGVSSGSVRWADLRGVGRADCTLHTFDTTGKVTIHSMPCSSSQPVDFISGYENGIGAKATVLYAPLSDPDTYTATDTASKTTASAVNAMAHNVSSSVAIGSSSVAQTIGHNRTELVHFPSFVVKTLSNVPRATQPEVVESKGFAYKNARLGFDGRGWLGFESMTKTLQPLRIREVTTYHQTFPLLGQTSQVITSEAAEDRVLKSNQYTWNSTSINDGSNQSVFLQSCRETYYEGGVSSYDVDVSYQHDSYANITQMDIESSQANVPALSIRSTFDNNAESWVIGNKTSEIVEQFPVATTQQATVLKQTKYAYVPGTRISSETSTLVDGSTWSTQSFEFDPTGNEIVVNGPGQSRRSFIYDDTYSTIVSSSSFTGPDDDSVLKETAIFDLGLGKPLSVTDANGHITLRTYDVLGRVKDVSEGSSSGMTLMEKHSFHFEDGDFFESRDVWAGSYPDDNHWSTTRSYFDGLKQVWKTETSRPDDPSAMIISEVKYDGAGRIVARSRDYLVGSTPAFGTYTYDTKSRVVKEEFPPAAENVSPVTTSYEYDFNSVSGLAEVMETRSDGQTTEVIARELLYLPSSEPSAGHFVNPFVTRIVNELGQDIHTRFDGLGRPISIKDGADVELSLSWDGLSRQVERRISKPGTDTSNTTSHLSVKYDDDISQSTTRNELTGSTVVTQFDFVQRPISKTIANATAVEETLTFTYDNGGEYPKERLVDVASSKGIEQHFDYDIKGHVTRTHLSLDGQKFTTTHEWTPAGQLLKTTNPDGTTMTHSLLPDGETVGKIELADAEQVRASITLSEYDNVFSRPLVCEFGNGIKSTSTIESNGSLSSISMFLGSNSLHHQDWKIDAFGRIGEYNVTHTDLNPVRSSFQYDTAGQLLHRVSDSTAFSASTGPETFSYDQSGNLSSKGGKTFIHDGWQLMSVRNEAGNTESSFEYSIDGNLTAKLDSDGAKTSVMQYDFNSRLIDLDGTTFLYDFGGRLIKSTSPTGDVTIYPSQTYEVSISVSGQKSHTAYLIHGYRRASLTTEESTTGSPTVYYFHNDHLGSTIAASSATGEMVTRYQYDSFGRVSVDGPDVARYKFSGKEQFGSLYYYGARFYDPDTARFLTLDDFPISLRQISPSTFNMYTFSRNDPINFVDLNGNVPWWHWLVDVLLIAVGVAALFIPVPGLNSIISGTLIGAGMNGLSYDYDATKNGAYKDSDWGIQIGLGAAFGFISAGIGVALEAALPAVTFVEAAATRGASGAFKLTEIGGLVGRSALRLVVSAGAGSATSVLQQLANNAIAGRPLDEGLGKAAWMGALKTLGTQSLSDIYAFSPIKPSFSLKLYKKKDWGIYHMAYESQRSNLPGLTQSTRVQYPTAQVGSEPTLILYRPNPFFDSAFDSFDPSTAARHLPVHDITSF